MLGKCMKWGQVVKCMGKCLVLAGSWCSVCFLSNKILWLFPFGRWLWKARIQRILCFECKNFSQFLESSYVYNGFGALVSKIEANHCLKLFILLGLNINLKWSFKTLLCLLCIWDCRALPLNTIVTHNTDDSHFKHSVVQRAKKKIIIKLGSFKKYCLHFSTLDSGE